MTETCLVEFKFDDYLAANWLIFHRRTLRRGAIRIFVTCWVGLLLLTFALSPAFGVGNVFVASVGALGSVIGWLVCVYVSIPRGARRVFDKIQGRGLITEYSFNERQFTASNRLGVATLEWPLIDSWLESPDLFVVCAATGILYILPTNQIDKGELAALKSTLVNAGVRNG